MVKTLEELAMEEKFIGVYDRNHENIIMQNTVYDEGYEKGEISGIEKGIEKGIIQGREEGSMNKSIEIAKEMLDMHYDIKEISKITKLSIDDINELSKK